MLFERFGDNIDLRVDMKFGIDIFQVGIYGMEAYAQLIRQVLFTVTVY